MLVFVPESTQIQRVLLHSQQSQVLSHQTEVASSSLHVVQGVGTDCSQLAQSHLPHSTAHTHPFLDKTQEG